MKVYFDNMNMVSHEYDRVVPWNIIGDGIGVYAYRTNEGSYHCLRPSEVGTYTEKICRPQGRV